MIRMTIEMFMMPPIESNSEFTISRMLGLRLMNRNGRSTRSILKI